MAEGQTEIFSFGSGDFVKQSEAVDVAWSQRYMTMQTESCAEFAHGDIAN